LSVADAVARIALQTEVEAHEITDVRFVFDDENAG